MYQTEVRVFNTKASIIEASSEEYKRYKGIHFLLLIPLDILEVTMIKILKIIAISSYEIQSVGID